jgi:hypothetical protein
MKQDSSNRLSIISSAGREQCPFAQDSMKKGTPWPRKWRRTRCPGQHEERRHEERRHGQQDERLAKDTMKKDNMTKDGMSQQTRCQKDTMGKDMMGK